MDKQPKYGLRKSKKGLVSGIIASVIIGMTLGEVAFSANSYVKSNEEVPTYDVSNWTANTVDEIKNEIDSQVENNNAPFGISEEEAKAHDWYEIRWGDTVWGITSALGIDLDEFVRVNGIENPDLIYADDWVMLDITEMVNVDDYEDASLYVEQSYSENSQPVKTEKVVAEKPSTEKPSTEKPVIDNSEIKAPVVEKPVIEKPEVEEPKVEEPEVEEPEVEEPEVEEPEVEEPEVEEPVVEEPEVEEPEVEEPEVEEPEVEEPEVEEPEVEEPEVEEPEVEEPEVEEPVEDEEDQEEQETVVKTEVKSEVIEFVIEYVTDETLAPGEEKIIQEGVNGEVRETYEYTYLDDVLISEELIHTETIPALPQKIAIGPEDPLVYSAHAFDSDGNPLVNENIYVYDADLLVDTAITDEIGYFITHVLPNIEYDIKGDGYHSIVEGTEKDQFTIENIEGETKLGRTVTTAQSEIKFKPSAKVFDLDAEDVTFAPDESWVIIDQVLDLNVGETIYITPARDYLTGQVFNVASYETNGYQTLIYTATTTWDELIEYITIDTGDEGVSVGDMEIINQPWVTVDTEEIEKMDDPSLFSFFSDPLLDEKMELGLIFNVDFGKLFQGELDNVLSVDDYSIKFNEYELTKDPIVIPIGDTEFILYGEHMELIYNHLLVGLDRDKNFEIINNGNYFKRQGNSYQAKYEDREVTYDTDGKIKFVDGDISFGIDKSFNFEMIGKDNYITRNGNNFSLKYNPLELIIVENKITDVRYENREISFDENGKAEFIQGVNKLVIDKNNFEVLLQLDNNYIKLNSTALEFLMDDLNLILNGDSSIVLTKGNTSLRLNANQPADILFELDGNQLQLTGSAVALSRGDLQLAFSEDYTLSLTTGPNTIQVNPDNVLEITLSENSYQIDINNLKNYSFSSAVKDFDLANFVMSGHSDSIYDYLKGEVDQIEKDDIDFDGIKDSMVDRFEGSVNTRVKLNGDIRILADIRGLTNNSASITQNLNATLDTNIKLSFKEQDEPYRVPLAVLTIPQIPIATLNVDLIFDIFGNMEVITSLGLSTRTQISMENLAFDSDYDVNFDTAYGSVVGEGSGELGLQFIPMIGIDHLGVDLTFSGTILPNIQFEGEISSDENAENSGVVEGKIDGNIRASLGFEAGLYPGAVEETRFSKEFDVPLNKGSQEDRTFFNEAKVIVALTGVSGELELFDKTFPIWSYTSGQEAGNLFILLDNGRLETANFTVGGEIFDSNFFGDSITSDYIYRWNNPYEGDVNRNGTYWIIDLDNVISKTGTQYKTIVYRSTSNTRVYLHRLLVNEPDVIQNHTALIGDRIILPDAFDISEIRGLPDNLEFTKENGQWISNEITSDMSGDYVVYVIGEETITGDETGIGDTVEFHDRDEIYEVKNKYLYNYYIDSFKLTIPKSTEL